MSERLEKQIEDLGTHLNTRLDTIDLTLRLKQIEDAGRFATLETKTKENTGDINAIGGKIRTHLGDHGKWVLYPVGAVATTAGLIAGAYSLFK